MNPSNGGWFILVTLLLAMVLTVFDRPQWLPEWLSAWRPAWVILVLFFWVIEVPERIGLIMAWVTGLMLDVLLADPLGLNGFCLAAITFVAWSFYERIRMYSILQQGILIFVLVAAVELLRDVVASVVLGVPMSLGFLLSAVTTTILWPFVSEMLHRFGTRFAVR